MKTASAGFMLAPPDHEARQLAPGRSFAAANLPPNLRWWLLVGGLLRFRTRRSVADTCAQSVPRPGCR
ncbi:MAG: hypothetical protein ACK4WH_10955 [Phycisphaerales bacterium]